MAVVVKWVFEDPAESQEYIFHINPNAGGSPAYRKNITQQATVAPGGKTLLFEGADSPQEFSFSGVILEEAQYNAFVEWWQKRRQIKLTDDLDREYWIYITSFEPTRVRARSHPWKHTYNASALRLDWP